MTDDRQAEAQTGMRAGAGRVPLPESVEHIRENIRLDADARVGDLGTHEPLPLGESDPYLPVGFGELHRVRQEVPEHLLQATAVADEERQRFRNLQIDPYALCIGGWLHHLQGTRRHCRNIHRFGLQADLACDDAREIQQIVDEAGLRHRVAFDHRDGVLDLIPDLPAAQNPCPAEHRVQWRAQLVRQDRQKLVLHAPGRLGVRVGAPRVSQQPLALLLDAAALFVRPHLIGDVLVDEHDLHDGPFPILQRVHHRADPAPRIFVGAQVRQRDVRVVHGGRDTRRVPLERPADMRHQAPLGELRVLEQVVLPEPFQRSTPQALPCLVDVKGLSVRAEDLDTQRGLLDQLTVARLR